LPQGGALETPGTTKKSMPCIQYLSSLSQDPEGAGFQVEIIRTGPAKYGNQQLPFGAIERLPVASYRDIYDRIQELHGGGSYRLRVLNEEGHQVHAMVFSIDVTQVAPIPRTPNGGYGVAAQPGIMGAGNFATVGGAQDDINALRAEEARARSEEAVIVARNRVEQTQRNIERNRRREEEEEQRRMQGPQNAEAAVKMNDLKHETERRFDLMNASFKELLLMLNTQKPADNGMATMMPLLIEMMKSSAQQTTAIVTAMLSGGGDKSKDMMQFLQLQNQASDKMMTVLMNNATAAASKSERLLEGVLLKRLDQPEESLKQALDMQERGKKDAMEMFRMLEDARGDRDEGEFINPDSGFLGNMGNLILHGLKSLVSGAARGGSTKAIELLSGILQKPAGTTQFSEQDLQVAADRIAQARIAGQARPALPALPAPQAPGQIPIPQAPTPAPVVRPKVKLFDRVYDIIDETPVAPVAPAVQETTLTPIPLPETAAVVEAPVQQGVMVETIEQQTVVQVPAAPPEQAEMQGDDYVNEGIAMAVADIKAGRREHDWVEFALGKWTRDYLNSLAQAPNDEARIQILQQASDPGLFQELISLLLDANKPHNYRDFMENLKALLDGVAEGGLNAAA
jgi:hypothetical protein